MLFMMLSHSSIQAVQFVHSSCVPLRISIPVGHTCTHCMQSMQSPFPEAGRSSFLLNLARPVSFSPRTKSYATLIDLLSSKTPCNLPYGQAMMHTCSRNETKTK